MLRDFGIALSLSNLCFISVWRTLLLPSYSFYYYHTEAPPTGIHYLATVIDVLLLGVLLFIAARLVRLSRSSWVRTTARIAFILVLMFALYGVLSQIDHPAVRKLIMGWSDQMVANRLVLTIPIIGVLFVTLLALLRISKAVKLGVTALLILTPFVFVTFAQAAFIARKYRAPEQVSLAPPLPNNASQKVRVLWLIFDEFDYRVAFAQRPSSLKLDELDRLSKESLFATNAYPPAGETFLSFPALITGHLVADARRVSPQELMIKFSDDSEAVPWSKQPNIFSHARELGFNTAAIGWYHPYCRVLGQSLTSCHWLGQGPILNTQAEQRRQYSFATAHGIGHSMWSALEHAFYAAPLASIILPKSVTTEALNKEQVAFYNTMLQEVTRTAVKPEFGLIMAHWSIPHPPCIYDSASGNLSSELGRSYIENIQLVDRTLGTLRRVMEERGIWDDTIVLVTSDHWWRTDEWERLPGWTAQDENLKPTSPDHRIPFILKLSGKQSGLRYTPEFNTVLTHDLLLSILKNEIPGMQSAAFWLDKARSNGRAMNDHRGAKLDH